MKTKGHDVVVSEYLCNVPEGWEVIWKYESKKGMRNKEGVQESTVEGYRDWETDRKSTRLNSSHSAKSRMPSSA